MMRRRLEIFVPIVILAILVQVFAPVAAFRVVANAVSDPIYMASICEGRVSSQDESKTVPVNTQHHSGKCCAACTAGHGGTLAVDPPTPVFVSLQREYQLVSWLEAAEPMPPLKVGSNAQARAPPSYS
jgi:hypothetical protein